MCAKMPSSSSRLPEATTNLPFPERGVLEGDLGAELVGQFEFQTRMSACRAARPQRGRVQGISASVSRTERAFLAALVAKKALSVRETEALVRRLLAPAPKHEDAPPDPDIRRLELELADKLGAKVAFQHTASGKGKLVVAYNSLDELEGILAHIN